MVRVVILWVHVLCGVAWIGACASFVIAAAALGDEPEEATALALRTVPLINRVCVPLAIVIPLTGLGNLLFAARAHGFVLPAEFVAILAAKIGLFTTMAAALWGAWRTAAAFREQPASGERPSRAKIRKLVTLYGLIIAAGTMALGLGLWLSGT